MRVLRIVEGTSVDGPGLRTSVYLAGCRHHCEGCHNPQSWNRDGGTEMSVDDILRVIAYNEAPVTLSGGDPLEQATEVAELVARIKRELGYNVWCYTGFQWEEILDSPPLLNAIRQVDVVVDGRFVNALRDTSLLFKGSKNQRLINVSESLKSHSTILANLPYMTV